MSADHSAEKDACDCGHSGDQHDAMGCAADDEMGLGYCECSAPAYLLGDDGGSND